MTFPMSTSIAAIPFGDTSTTESNMLDKIRPKSVSFDPDIDWLKESKKRSRRKKWKRRSKQRCLQDLRTEAGRATKEKACVAYRFLRGNRQYLLDRYDEDWVFAATLHTCVDELLDLKPRPPSQESREEMEDSLQKLEANDLSFSRIRSMGIYFLAMIHAVFVQDGAIEPELEDEVETTSFVSYDIPREITRPFGDVSNNHSQHSGGRSQPPYQKVPSQENRGISSSHQSISFSTSSSRLKRARLAPAGFVSDENSEKGDTTRKKTKRCIPSSVGCTY